MIKIKNPNDIVEAFVADYRDLFNDELISVVMFGSAVTHEYRPGISDINMVIVLREYSIARIRSSIATAKKWAKRNVTVPFFMTKEFIAHSLDSYPIEFLDIQSNYRVLFGEDVFSQLDIKRSDLRLQCERELRGISIHLRKEFISSGGNSRVLFKLLNASLKRLMPVFRAMLKLTDKSVPNMKSDVIMAVEDRFNLGASALSHALELDRLTTNGGGALGDFFDKYAKAIDALIESIDSVTFERAGT
jgi:predicted nucleotidyltransferase